MRIKLTLNFRKFNETTERGDSGTYSGLNIQKKASIDVKRTDPPLEQALTVYHEITHAIFDLFLDFKMNNKRGRAEAQDPQIRKNWDEYNKTYRKKNAKKEDKEEEICSKVEQAVKRVLKKELPPEFLDQIFDE